MPTVLETLNSSLHHAFSDDNRVYLLGEDVLDPYGGAFKVTRGLSTQYPDRVLTTPISEAGFVGVAAGMALRGLRPVVEIMFGDFTTLIADQVVNHVSKFHWMYNQQVSLPLVIRTPMGGRRGYGPTHSQTLEKMFLGIPGLRVVAPAAFCRMDGSGGPGDLLYQSILGSSEPTLFIENKLQYYLHVQNQSDLEDLSLEIAPAGSESLLPIHTLSVRGAPAATLTIAAYGYMAELAMQAVRRLAYEHELFAQLVVPTQLSPFLVEPILASANRTGGLLVVEEGTLSLGWGAELLARLAEIDGTHSIWSRRLAAQEVPVPASMPYEAAVLPGVEQIIQYAIQRKL
jgi:pyruvate/2-oxoglutarate/acetoin dehydrogenase E1 component